MWSPFKLFNKKNKPITINDEWVTANIKEGDVVIDCGANIGQETIPLAKTGAEVYSFEPNPYAFEELKKATKDFPKVHCINKGVLDKNDKMKLYLHENSDDDELTWSTGSSFVAEKKNVKKDKFVEIEIIDLIEFIRNLNTNIKLLKIDVEGVEYEILDKLIDSGLLNKVEQVLVETHAEKIPELKEKDTAIRKKIEDRKITNINLNWI